MGTVQHYAIKYTPEAGPKHIDKISRGDATAWIPGARQGIRILGASTVHEVVTVLPDPSDEQLIEVALKLAMQEPPLTMEESWKFYDGVLGGIRVWHEDIEEAAHV